MKKLIIQSIIFFALALVITYFTYDDNRMQAKLEARYGTNTVQ